MGIDRSRLEAFKFQMTIGFVVLSGTPLIFEVVDYIRHQVSLQDIALDQKWERADLACSHAAREVVLAFGRKRIEIQSPEIPVASLLHGASVIREQGQNLPIVHIITQRAVREALARFS